jgi:hypothetical protein
MPNVTTRKTLKDTLEAIAQEKGLRWEDVRHLTTATFAALVDRKARQAKPRAVTRADLDRAPPGAHLHCDICGSTYSATPADYFMMAPTDKFTCCEVPLALVVRQVTVRRVTT